MGQFPCLLDKPTDILTSCSATDLYGEHVTRGPIEGPSINYVTPKGGRGPAKRYCTVFLLLKLHVMISKSFLVDIHDLLDSTICMSAWQASDVTNTKSPLADLFTSQHIRTTHGSLLLTPAATM